MSKIEAASRPVLEPLIFGNQASLSPSEQMLIARWGYKTILMLAFLNPERRPISDAHYVWFFENRTPPASVRMSLLHYSGPIETISYYSAGLITTAATLPPNAEPPEHTNTYVITFSVGRLVYHAYGRTDITEAPNVTVDNPSAVVELWPVSLRDVFWPPARSLDLDGLDALGWPVAR